jgi:hypothetical protein
MARALYSRLALLGGRYADVAPAATSCCNACRTCATTNIFAVLSGIGVALAARFRRSS